MSPEIPQVENGSFGAAHHDNNLHGGSEDIYDIDSMGGEKFLPALLDLWDGKIVRAAKTDKGCVGSQAGADKFGCHVIAAQGTLE